SGSGLAGSLSWTYRNPPHSVRPSNPRTPWPGPWSDWRWCCQTPAVFAEADACWGPWPTTGAKLARLGAGPGMSCPPGEPGGHDHGVWLPGGPECAVVSGGEVGLDLWLGRHEREHLRAARAVEGGPGQSRGRGVAGGGEVRPGRAHAGREGLLVGAQWCGEVRVRQVEQVLEFGGVGGYGPDNAGRYEDLRRVVVVELVGVGRHALGGLLVDLQCRAGEVGVPDQRAEGCVR